jgi:hypothetical protein
VAWLVDDAFEEFHTRINLPGNHRMTATNRKDWIVRRLNPCFNILDAFAMGSIPKYTALEGHADLDVMVVLHFGEHIKAKTPAQVLNDVRTMLGTGAGSVRRNGQAVTMRFESWPNVDVVPASVTYADELKKTVDHYNIPDMHRGVWLPTRPRKHAKAIEAAASFNGPQFRQVIKMIKDWNRRQPVRLQSYHIEVIALKMLGGFDDYAWDVYQWFETAQEHIWSCVYEGEDITDYLAVGERAVVLDQLKRAEKLAGDAWHFTYNGRGRHKEAIACLRQLFGQRFPTYG